MQSEQDKLEDVSHKLGNFIVDVCRGSKSELRSPVMESFFVNIGIKHFSRAV
jgi:hypothetical protein